MPGAFGGELLQWSNQAGPSRASSSQAGPSWASGDGGDGSDEDDDSAALARRLQAEEEDYARATHDDSAAEQSLALAHRLQAEDEAAEARAARHTAEEHWDDAALVAAHDDARAEEGLALALRLQAEEQEAEARTAREAAEGRCKDAAMVAQVTEKDRRAQERRLKQLTRRPLAARSLASARSLLNRSATTRTPRQSIRAKVTPNNIRYAKLRGERGFARSRRAYSSTASGPLWEEAHRYVDEMQPPARYADRQRAAHELATSLSAMYMSSPFYALELLRNVVAIGADLDAPLVGSLLSLAEEAGEAQPPDEYTWQLVLSVLTNMGVGGGVEAILQERDTILFLAGLLTTGEARTREYALACVYNLASGAGAAKPERREQRFRTELLDVLASEGVQPALRSAAQGSGQNAEFAQRILNCTRRHTALSRRARCSSSAPGHTAAATLATGAHEEGNEAAGTPEEAVAFGRRWRERLRRRARGYDVVLAVISPDWATDVVCVQDPESAEAAASAEEVLVDAEEVRADADEVRVDIVPATGGAGLGTRKRMAVAAALAADAMGPAPSEPRTAHRYHTVATAEYTHPAEAEDDADSDCADTIDECGRGARTGSRYSAVTTVEI